MTKYQAVHLRLMSTLPVRTVSAKGRKREYASSRGCIVPTDRFKIERMREMDAQGIERRLIAREVGVSSATIVRHLGKRKKGRGVAPSPR